MNLDPYILSDPYALAKTAHNTIMNRRRLPHTRKAINHKVKIGEHKFYLTVGLFEDGSPGELFVHGDKAFGTINGLLDQFCICISMLFQLGMPVEDIVKKFSNQRFQPSGPTSDKAIPMCSSIVDYISKWLELMFVKNNQISLQTQQIDKSRP